MARARRLEPKAREMIKQKLYEAGEITTEELMEMIDPHYLFEKVAARKREVRRMAQQMMSAMRDEKGVRTTFNCNIDGVSKYVNIEASNDIDNLRGVDVQLRTKLEGLKASSAKASRRRLEVEGQISFDLEEMREEEG